MDQILDTFPFGLGVAVPAQLGNRVRRTAERLDLHTIKAIVEGEVSTGELESRSAQDTGMAQSADCNRKRIDSELQDREPP